MISDERSCSLVDTVLVRHLVNAAHTNELRVSRDVISETQRVYLCGMLMLQNKFILTDEVCVCVSIVDVTSTQLFLSLARQFISALARLSNVNVCDR